MTILHLCNDFAGSTVHSELYRRLDDLGVKQIVYCPLRDAKRIGNNAFEGKQTEIIYSPILRKIHRLCFHLKINKIAKDIEQKIDLSQIDCIHATTLFSDGAVARKLSRKYGIPYIAAVRNTDINDFMRYAPHLWLLHRKIVRGAKKIVFISPSLQRRTTQHWTLSGLRKQLNEKAMFIPNGINDYWLNHLNINKKEENHNILYVGRFDNNKNVLRLIRTVLELRKRLSDIHLDLIGGDGEQESAILELVKQNPATLTYHGKIFDKPLLQSIYLKNSIFAMPSKRETFGLVYLEALSQGLRVLYTHGEGIDGLFTKKVGESVNPFREKEIENALWKLLSEPDQYETPDNEDFKQFSWDEVAKKYLEVYELR